MRRVLPDQCRALAASQERRLCLNCAWCNQANRVSRLLGDKEHLAGVASILDEVMRLRRIIKLEARRHLRSNDIACRKFHQCFAPFAQAIDLVPQMADIYAEYAFVRVHETNRIELKPWSVGKHGKYGQDIAFLAGR